MIKSRVFGTTLQVDHARSRPYFQWEVYHGYVLTHTAILTLSAAFVCLFCCLSMALLLILRVLLLIPVQSGIGTRDWLYLSVGDVRILLQGPSLIAFSWDLLLLIRLLSYTFTRGTNV